MAKKVVRVYFMDESFKAVGIDPTCTAEQLRQTIIEKISLKEDACFSIFEKKEEWERCLESEEKPADIMKNWEQAAVEKAKAAGLSSTPVVSAASNPGASEPVFVFKKKIFLREDDKELQDTVAKNLVYIQAVSNVIDSVYISSIDEAMRLAGLKLHITYGDHNAATHQVGFLTHDLKKFVPKHLFNAKKPSDWESQVLKEHAKLKGKQKEDAKAEYIQIVKVWRDYGTTFFPPCKTLGAKNLPSKVVIGVNFEGVRLLKPKNKETLSEHLFTEITCWSSSSGTFSFDCGTATEVLRFSFDTKQGSIIASTIQAYIDILVQMIKCMEDDEETPSLGNTITTNTSENQDTE